MQKYHLEIFNTKSPSFVLLGPQSLFSCTVCTLCHDIVLFFCGWNVGVVTLLATTVVRKLVYWGPFGSWPTSLTRFSLRTRRVEKAFVGRGGEEEATLLGSAPLLALSLIHGRQWLDGWRFADTCLEVGATGRTHRRPCGASYRGDAVNGRARYLVEQIVMLAISSQRNENLPLKCTFSTSSIADLGHHSLVDISSPQMWNSCILCVLGRAPDKLSHPQLPLDLSSCAIEKCIRLILQTDLSIHQVLGLL